MAITSTRTADSFVAPADDSGKGSDDVLLRASGNDTLDSADDQDALFLSGSDDTRDSADGKDVVIVAGSDTLYSPSDQDQLVPDHTGTDDGFFDIAVADFDFLDGGGQPIVEDDSGAAAASRAGGHMTVLEDYAVAYPDGFFI